MKEDKQEVLISTETEPNGTEYLGSVNSDLLIKNSTFSKNFNISPQELTNIVNKYKERDENMQDIKYFQEKNGIDFLLNAVDTSKTTGINSLEGREEYFGSNKIFRKPPPSFWDFVIEALSDKMIIILIFCSLFEIGISFFIFYMMNKKIIWIG